MRIVITGNLGYVGSVLTEHLRASFPKAILVGLDTGFFASCFTGSHESYKDLVDIQHVADVRDVGEEVLEGAQALVLLAAISNDPMGKAFERVTDEVNRDSCVRLMRLARAKGVQRVVFASSCSVYGFSEGGARNEQAKLNPLTAYARSKMEAELALRNLADEEILVTCLRFPTACGMSPRIRLDLVLNDFTASAVANGRIQILSDGTPWRPLIDVRDMARAIEWALKRESGQGGAFLAINAGRDEANYQVRDLAEAVRRVMPSVTIHINEAAQPDRRSYQVDFSLYRQLAPTYLPAVTLEQSIFRLVEGLEAAGFDDVNFRESEFIRLKVLAGLRSKGLLDGDLRWVHR